MVRGRGSISCGRQEQLNPLLLTVHPPLFQGIYAAKSFKQTCLALDHSMALSAFSHIVIQTHICSPPFVICNTFSNKVTSNGIGLLLQCQCWGCHNTGSSTIILPKVLNRSCLIQGFTSDWPHTQLSPSLGTAISQINND